MAETDGSQPRVPIVAPVPVPMTFDVEPVPTQVGMLVRVVVHSATGAFVMFISPDEARALSSLIDRAALQARSGLVVPKGHVPKPKDPEAN